MVTRRLIAGLAISLALAGAVQADMPTTILIGTPPQPGWSLLSTQQKIILAPLVGDWDQMDNIRRKKWLGIAERFPKMTPEEQARVQQRMREWAALTPAQRAKVRDSYKEFNQLDPEKKLAVKKKWEAYSNLSEEEKIRARQPKAPPTESAATAISTPNSASTATTAATAETPTPSTETEKP
jgi:hypothetical protein